MDNNFKAPAAQTQITRALRLSVFARTKFYSVAKKEKEETERRKEVGVPRCVLLPGELVAGERFPLGAFFFLETIHRRKQRIEFRRAGGVAVGPVASRRVLRGAGRFLWRATRKFRRSWLPRLRVLAVARRHGPRVVRERRRLVGDLGRVRLVARLLSRRQQPTHVSFYGRIWGNYVAILLSPACY